MQRNPAYQLQPDDVLSMKFPLTPEYNQVVTVQPDGSITLVGAGELHVAGDTVEGARQAILAAYAHTLHNPILLFDLENFQKPFFVVGGQVGHPGKYPLRGDLTLVQGLQMAGGFLPSSRHSDVWLYRRISDRWMEGEKINVKKMLRKGNLQEDVMLHPGDLIYVPKNTLSKIMRFIPVPSVGTYMSPVP